MSVSVTRFLLPILQATDADLISNITYRIRTDAARQLFAVDRITGALSVLQSLDFEALGRDGANYTFQVEALDYEGVLPPGMATVTVRITVRQCCGSAEYDAQTKPSLLTSTTYI